MGDTETQVQQADVQQPEGAGAAQAKADVQIDYAKLDEIISKRQQQAGNAAGKAFLEQQGLTGDELTAAINAYKASKKADAEKQKTAYADMQKENAALKAQIMQGKVDAASSKIAAELGVDAKNAAYLAKLADMSKAVKADGNIDEDAIKEAFTAVLKDLPGLKGAAQHSGFTVGANVAQTQTDAADEIRRLMGVKIKK